ncbi:hypothetical protein NDU88_001755 [Pleurodeles waltl]|uniref:Uncharacterized protein n=1 Tax=Pleurodeles waltl TaxID=8319 RepID=A0AAV7SDR2_PLEWA|nr:hypothetical protein NDU88_001755 [Pleurodeles waltl]
MLLHCVKVHMEECTVVRATWRLCNREAREAPPTWNPRPQSEPRSRPSTIGYRDRGTGPPPVTSSTLSEVPAVRITAAAADKGALSAPCMEKPPRSRVARAPYRALAFYEAGCCDGL